MDRFDEKKHDRTDEIAADSHDETVERRDEPIREGDILGLAGSTVPKSPGDPSASHDPDAVARQRARMREGEAEATRERASEDTFGATAVDLGAGKGNTITRK